jgi:hypothetical protein
MILEKFGTIESHLAKQTKQTPFSLITFGGADNTEALNELREAALEAKRERAEDKKETLALLREAERERAEDKKETLALYKANATETKYLNGIFNTIILATFFAILSPSFGVVLQSYLVPILNPILNPPPIVNLK